MRRRPNSTAGARDRSGTDGRARGAAGRPGSPLTGLAGLLLGATLALPACGDFSNASLDRLYAPGAGTDPGAPPGAPGDPVDGPLAELLLKPAPSLVHAAYGEPFALQLGVRDHDPDAVCWAVTTGALPGGLSLDPDTGLVFGAARTAAPGVSTVRVRATSPCVGAPIAAGELELNIATSAACGPDAACAVDEVCAPDGVCRLDVAGSCPMPVGPSFVFEPLQGGASGLRLFERAEVMVNGIDPDAAPGEPDRLLSVRANGEDFGFRYQLPGGLLLPVEVGAEIELRAQMGPADGRYVLIRTDPAALGFAFAGYAGPVDESHLWTSICAGLKHCPFIQDMDIVLTSGCDTGLGCAGSPMGLRLKSSPLPVLPGQQGAWLQTNEGLSLYTVLLSDAASVAGCGTAPMADALTYLLLEGSRPHPLIRHVEADVYLNTVPRVVSISGAQSLSASLTGKVETWLWSAELPDGSPELAAGQGPEVDLPLILAGDAIVRLRVAEAKPAGVSSTEAALRLRVRPGNGVHVELVWSDPEAALSLAAAPDIAGDAAGDAAWLTASSAPGWAVSATVVDRPAGASVEVMRVPPEVAESAGALRLHLRGDDTRETSATVKIYLHGRLAESFSLTVAPGEDRPLALIDAASGDVTGAAPVRAPR